MPSYRAVEPQQISAEDVRILDWADAIWCRSFGAGLGIQPLLDCERRGDRTALGRLSFDACQRIAVELSRLAQRHRPGEPDG
jgi:hypothetical protein